MLAVSRSFAIIGFNNRFGSRLRIRTSRGFQTDKNTTDGDFGQSPAKLPSRGASFFDINHGSPFDLSHGLNFSLAVPIVWRPAQTCERH
jgi:hypothetical protein